MRPILKHLNDTEIEVYSNSIFPIKVCGPFKFWVTTKNPKDDIRRGKKVALAHVKTFKKVKIVVPTIGYKGSYRITPEIVLSQLDRKDFLQVQGYSVKVGKPVCEYDPAMSAVDPTYYEANVTLYQSTRRPEKLVLQSYELPSAQNSENEKTKN